jgi:hypothetical protein
MATSTDHRPVLSLELPAVDPLLELVEAREGDVESKFIGRTEARLARLMDKAAEQAAQQSTEQAQAEPVNDINQWPLLIKFNEVPGVPLETNLVESIVTASRSSTRTHRPRPARH